jgi:hypothetical protein
MVTTCLALACCLLGQDAALPPPSFDALPSRGAPEQPTSRRPRAAAPVIDSNQEPAAIDHGAAAPDGLDGDRLAGQADDREPIGESDTVATPSNSDLHPPATLPPGTRLEPSTPTHPADSPAAVLSDAAAIRAQLEVTGSPLRLLDMLGRARDSRARLAAIDAYWALSIAWITAQWQWWDHDFVERMEAMSPTANDPLDQQTLTAQFRSRLSSTEADIRQAEGDLVEAQQRLATMIRLQSNEALPLAVDLPHVGAYRTRFEALYTGQPAPERPLAIHRMLPLRERELRTRAEAIEAARDALDAAEAGYQQGTVALDTVMSRLDDQTRERLAFLNVVRKYNFEIAEYALVTPIPAADDRTLAARLIKLRPEDGWHLEPRRQSTPSAATGEAALPIAVTPPTSDSSAVPAQHQRTINQPDGVEQATFDAPRRNARSMPARSEQESAAPLRIEGTSPAARFRTPAGDEISPPPGDQLP